MVNGTDGLFTLSSSRGVSSLRFPGPKGQSMMVDRFALSEEDRMMEDAATIGSIFMFSSESVGSLLTLCGSIAVR